ncbi:MAG TPA: PEGA domain-containing protein [Kofleriaceae bacterium]|nr:PEGA domain-containing protein [Kofleriaceae bacterium]
MIEGEAEILQSSNKPTVLYGRPGMTIKFVEPDEPSKVIIGELEKARLAMKVPAPSVPPRPANVPPEPRPTPPAPGGRIDATNALAECVVIGDPSTLKETANAPRAIGGEGSGKAKFIVPSIPSAPPGRAKTPSIPGEPTVNTAPPQPPARELPKPTPIAKEASKPSAAPIAPIAREPSKPGPVAAIAREPSKPTANRDPSLKMTSIGFPAIDKAPAPVKPANALLNTMLGTEAPPNPTKEIPAQAPPENPLLQTQHGVGAPKSAPVAKPVVSDDESTSIGEMPAKKSTDPMPAASPPPSTEAAPSLLPEPPRASKAHKATSIGFPAIRTPFETQPVGVVPPPSNAPRGEGEPAPPIVAKPRQGMPGPRGKNPTTPPLTPRHPTPAAPLPLVRPPAKPMVADEEEKTDLSAVPPAPKPAALPDEQPMPQVDPFAKTDLGGLVSSRSGGMRASEIMAAIPTEDWTMTPDASGPTVLPSKEEDGEAGDAGSGPVQVEAKKAPKGPPTGNWTISLDPEEGWSEPQKLPATAAPPPVVEKPAPPPRQTPRSGNPVTSVASSKALEAVEWEEKPTGIGEAKIEIDPTLMEPLKPMPALDDDDPNDPVAPPPAALAPPPSRQTGPVRAEMIPPPLAPMPPVGTGNLPAAAMMSPTGNMPIPGGGFSGFGTSSGFPAAPGSMHDLGASGSGASPEPSAATARKRMIIVIAAAAVAVVAGFLLVLLIAGGSKKKPGASGKGSAALITKGVGSQGSADRAITMGVPDAAVVEDEGSANDEGSDAGSGAGSQVAIETPEQGSAVAPPPPHDGPCKVDVSSVPTGADIYLAKAKVGTTPFSLELPCGTAATLTLKKARFLATDRTFTPSAVKANKITIKLGKTMFSLKVTSNPSGATITIGGKSAGVTPTTVKVAAFESSAITLSKPGFATDTQRVTPKQNGQAHHVVLKKGGRR